MTDFRIEKYTNEEFNALARYENGDLVSMFDNFLLLTPEQVNLLTEDDSSRYFECQEELDYELRSL